MNMLTRLMALMPGNKVTPILFLAAGWYGGAKFGAPDAFMASVDGIIAQGTDIVGGFLNNGGTAPGANG